MFFVTDRLISGRVLQFTLSLDLFRYHLDVPAETGPYEMAVLCRRSKGPRVEYYTPCDVIALRPNPRSIMQFLQYLGVTDRNSSSPSFKAATCTRFPSLFHNTTLFAVPWRKRSELLLAKF